MGLIPIVFLSRRDHGSARFQMSTNMYSYTLSNFLAVYSKRASLVLVTLSWPEVRSKCFQDITIIIRQPLSKKYHCNFKKCCI